MTVTQRPPAQPAEDLVGRGRRDGNRLFKEWYAELGAAADSGDPSAYVFVMGSTAEVLKAFDLNLVFPEINSLQMAVRKVSLDYLNKAED
ncbi:MAG TPA: hypothetical protein VNG04_03925, partial [Candidatus Acidoferrum sp.]|nr:hypothetical protein [Candidatus Acidoferrum sp.]